MSCHLLQMAIASIPLISPESRQLWSMFEPHRGEFAELLSDKQKGEIRKRSVSDEAEDRAYKSRACSNLLSCQEEQISSLTFICKNA